jgi:hypothetical protein
MRVCKIRKMAHHLRLINGIYQYQRKVPKHLAAICARITGKTTLSEKQREAGQTIPTLEWFIRSTATGNAREAERVRDDKIDAEYRALVKRAESFANPDAIADALNNGPADDVTFQQVASLTPEQAGAVLASIDTHHERESSRLDTLNALVADIRSMLRSAAPDQLGAARDNILGAMAATELKGKPMLPGDVIAIWKTERNAEKRPPSDDAIKNKERKMERMFAWIETNRPGFPMGCRDMRRIGADDMAAYRVALLADGLARDHLIDLKALFNTAKKAGMRPNPTEDIDVPNKATNTRLPFSVPDQRRILEAARDPEFIAKIVSPAAMARGVGAVSVVKWMHWVAAFSGTITSELVKIKINTIVFAPSAQPAEEHLSDDRSTEARRGAPLLPAEPVAMVWSLMIPGSKTMYRPRRLVIHDSLIAEGFLSYVETVRREYGDDAPLFPGWNEDQAGAAANKLIRELQIANPLLTHYSWRHVVCTRLDNVPQEVSPNLANYVTGHAPPSIKGKHYIHPELCDVKRAIDVLVDPTQAATDQRSAAAAA